MGTNRWENIMCEALILKITLNHVQKQEKKLIQIGGWEANGVWELLVKKSGPW